MKGGRREAEGRPGGGRGEAGGRPGGGQGKREREIVKAGAKRIERERRKKEERKKKGGGMKEKQELFALTASAV